MATRRTSTLIRPSPRLQDSVVSKRKCVICCQRGASAMRDRILDVLEEIRESLPDIILARTLPFPNVRTSFPITVPVPGTVVLPEVTDTLTLELADTDEALLAQLIGVISGISLKLSFCDNCCREFRQNKKRQRVKCTLPDGRVITINKRV